MVVRAPFRMKEPAQRLRLSGVSWSDYVAIGNAIGERPIRVTFDRGELEIMTTSGEHERLNTLLGRMVEALTIAVGLEIVSFGRASFQREDLERGMEPDDCYWIQNEALVRTVDKLDFLIHPPPDLVLEIEVSRSLLNRMGILRAIRVPEIWRYGRRALHVHLLGKGGRYQESEFSRAFPFLRVAELARFLHLRKQKGDNAILLEFIEWVRGQQAKGWPKKGK